jgi:hypothetical protein
MQTARQISRTTPEQMPGLRHVEPCFLDSVVEIHLVILMMTHGPIPGIRAWVVNARFFFPTSAGIGRRDND